MHKSAQEITVTSQCKGNSSRTQGKFSTVRIKYRNRIPRKPVKSLSWERSNKDSLWAGCWISCSLDFPSHLPITGGIHSGGNSILPVLERVRHIKGSWTPGNLPPLFKKVRAVGPAQRQPTFNTSDAQNQLPCTHYNGISSTEGIHKIGKYFQISVQTRVKVDFTSF